MLDVGDEPAKPQLADTSSSKDIGNNDHRASGTGSVQSAAQPPLSPVRSLQSVGQATQLAEPASHASYTYTGPASFSETGMQFPTLRQCMAFDSHAGRMAQLAETRRQYATLDSGLATWLSALTTVPEYAHAATVPLWAGGVGSPPPARASVVPHVPHVSMPSGSQISTKSKEIFSVATGKAGKGLMALRKKGFHKKAV